MNDEVRPENLKSRTKRFALSIIQLCAALPRDRAADVIGRQLIRSGTSVGAQYREGHRARSTAEFISKLESAIQELAETCYWLELLSESRIASGDAVLNATREAEELTAILVASVRTAKRNKETIKRA